MKDKTYNLEKNCACGKNQFLLFGASISRPRKYKCKFCDKVVASDDDKIL